MKSFLSILRECVPILFCNFFHKKHYQWSGNGDYKVQHCTKCDTRWAVPSHLACGKRVDSFQGLSNDRE